MISIALLGFGCVGSGTAEVLTENKKIIEERLGCEYQIKYILDLREFPDSPFGKLVVHDFDTILNDTACFCNDSTKTSCIIACRTIYCSIISARFYRSV